MKFIKHTIIAVAAALSLTTCDSGTNPIINGVDGPHVTVAGGNVIVSMVFKDLSIDGGATIPIPKYPNSSFQIGPDFQSGGTLFSLAVAVPDFLGNQGNGLDPQTLPGGRMLPGVAAGALPAVAVSVPVIKNSILYVGPEVIGLFVPFNGLDIGGAILTSNFYDSAKKRIGSISLVGADANGENSGILALMSPSLLGIFGERARNQALVNYYRHGMR